MKKTHTQTQTESSIVKAQTFKKWFLLCMSLVLAVGMMASLAACGGGSGGSDTESDSDNGSSSNTTGMPNPVVEVESIEEVNEQLGVNLAVPEGATIDRCAVIDDSLGEVDFTYEGTSYTFRAQESNTIEDISGLNYDFKAESEFDTANTTCIMRYNEEGPGYSHWYDDIAKTTYSVSMSDGATEASLTEISELLVAAQILM